MLHNLMIADYSVGHTGSVYDSWAFCSTWTFREHDQVFLSGEWMWADSAYPSEVWLVSPFKKPARGKLTPDQWTFNYHLSKVSANTVSWVSTARLVNHSARSASMSNTQLAFWKAGFSPCFSSAFKSTLTRIIFGRSCGFTVASYFTTSSCVSKPRTSIRIGTKSYTRSGIQQKGQSVESGGKQFNLGLMARATVKTRWNFNVPSTRSWRTDRGSTIESWMTFLTVLLVGLFVIHKYMRT